MTLENLDKTPFPWFGGKSQAAPLVWELLGDVAHYVEPFAGGLAVLLGRPHPCNRSYFSETVNDLDGFVVNFWRAIAFDPETTAHAASWPVAEADKSARQIALLRWKEAGALERLAGDATWYDPVMAGWWAWAVCVQIGAFTGDGPWTADPATGLIYKQARNGTREPGVKRNLPHLTTNGRGVNRPQAREPGVTRDRPHLTTDGQGVNHAGTREPGILDPVTPAHGQSALDTTDWGQAFHDQTMPELIRWFRYLAARLRHVRIVNGDWTRVCTYGAAKTLPVRQGNGPAGIFLDPPYDLGVRANGLYTHDIDGLAVAVRQWCIQNGNDPQYRIVLAGYDSEHEAELAAAGWRSYEWFVAGFLRGGMAQIGGAHQQARERLWASPHCLVPGADDAPVHAQLGIFTLDEDW